LHFTLIKVFGPSQKPFSTRQRAFLYEVGEEVPLLVDFNGIFLSFHCALFFARHFMKLLQKF